MGFIRPRSSFAHPQSAIGPVLVGMSPSPSISAVVHVPHTGRRRVIAQHGFSDAPICFHRIFLYKHVRLERTATLARCVHVTLYRRDVCPPCSQYAEPLMSYGGRDVVPVCRSGNSFADAQRPTYARRSS